MKKTKSECYIEKNVLIKKEPVGSFYFSLKLMDKRLVGRIKFPCASLSLSKDFKL